jgi:hypothetical protein
LYPIISDISISIKYKQTTTSPVDGCRLAASFQKVCMQFGPFNHFLLPKYANFCDLHVIQMPLASPNHEAMTPVYLILDNMSIHPLAS